MKTNTQGYVYILASKNCECIKIGGSDYPPLKRIKEINITEPYKSLGKWELADFRQVTNWRKVEYQLHYMFRSKLNRQQENQKELFYLSIKEASDALNKVDENLIINKPKVDRMFNDKQLFNYLQQLFIFSGLTHWLEYQGIWTFVLFPSTSGGRYFTLSIGAHEVAFSTLNKQDNLSEHMILVDRLILDSPNVVYWIKQHEGKFLENDYKTSLPRAISLYFKGDFQDTLEFLQLPGVRRALIAYWHEALFELKDLNQKSSYARFHNYNATIKLYHSINKI